MNEGAWRIERGGGWGGTSKCSVEWGSSSHHADVPWVTVTLLCYYKGLLFFNSVKCNTVFNNTMHRHPNLTTPALWSRPARGGFLCGPPTISLLQRRTSCFVFEDLRLFFFSKEGRHPCPLSAILGNTLPTHPSLDDFPLTCCNYFSFFPLLSMLYFSL